MTQTRSGAGGAHVAGTSANGATDDVTAGTRTHTQGYKSTTLTIIPFLYTAVLASVVAVTCCGSKYENIVFKIVMLVCSSSYLWINAFRKMAKYSTNSKP